jgi:haloalkane dehalogenase
MLPAGIERYVLEVDGFDMHVMEVGKGRPVLMVHGNPSWGFLYRKVAERLAGEPLRLIMPDLIGLGFSEKPPDLDVHQLDAHGAWLGSLIDQLELDDLIFMGQDWGGPIGLRALYDRPGVCAGMVVLNTVVGPPRPGFDATAFHRLSQTKLVSDIVFRVLGLPEKLMTLVQGNRRSILGKTRRAYTYPLRQFKDRAAPLALARMVPDSFEHPSIEAMNKCQEMFEAFEGPMSVVWGDRDPVLGSVRGWIEKLKPDAEITRTRAGHFLQEEVPDEIAAAVRSVATRLGTRAADERDRDPASAAEA